MLWPYRVFGFIGGLISALRHRRSAADIRDDQFNAVGKQLLDLQERRGIHSDAFGKWAVPPPMPDNVKPPARPGGPRTFRGAVTAEGAARVYAAALVSAPALKPTDRLMFAELAVREFCAVLDAEVPRAPMPPADED